MQVTEVRIFLANEERLKAYVTVTFDNCFVVRDLKVINGNNGLFVAMPSKQKKDGTYKDIAHPIHSDFRSYVERFILDKYNDELKMVEAGFPVHKEIDSYQHASIGISMHQDHEQVIPFGIQREYEAGIGPQVKK